MSTWRSLWLVTYFDIADADVLCNRSAHAARCCVLCIERSPVSLVARRKQRLIFGNDLRIRPRVCLTWKFFHFFLPDRGNRTYLRSTRSVPTSSFQLAFGLCESFESDVWRKSNLSELPCRCVNLRVNRKRKKFPWLIAIGFGWLHQ
jgi:hypothetical protein